MLLLLDIWGILAETIMSLKGQGQSRVQSRLSTQVPITSASPQGVLGNLAALSPGYLVSKMGTTVVFLYLTLMEVKFSGVWK